MFRQLNFVSQKNLAGVKYQITTNANCIYNGVLPTHTKSVSRNYAKYKRVRPKEPERPKLQDRSSCKQFTTIGKILNAMSAKTYASENKVSVIGLDDIGIATVFTLLTKNITNNICMVDLNEDILKGEQMDLQLSSLFLNNPRINSSKDPAMTRDSAVCIVTTGTYKGRDEDESQYIARNAGIIRAIVPPLVKYSPDTIFIIASDPVDVLSYATWKLSGVPKHRVIGTGTLLDSARFRYLLSEKMGISPLSCHASIIGQHGANSVPLWSSVDIAGVRLKDINPQIGTEKDPEDWQELHREVVKIDDAVRQLKGTTSWAVSLAIAEICHAIFTNANTVYPVSTLAKGEHCVREDVYLSLPCVLGRSGITDLVRLTITDMETSLFRRCAENVAAMQESANKILS